MRPTARLASPLDLSTAASIKSSCRKVICIGRNYADHIKELNNPPPTAPFFFLKPPTSLHPPSHAPIVRPRGVDLHHEVELGLVIGKPLRDVPASTPLAALLPSIASYILAIDLTARNLQSVNKSKGLPWTTAKGFDTFCPITEPFGVERFPDPYKLHLELVVERAGRREVRQSDSVGLMVFGIPRLVSEISSVMTLERGDVVLTGTPKGVGPLVGGERVEVGVSEEGREVEGVRSGWEVVDDGEGLFEFRGE